MFSFLKNIIKPIPKLQIQTQPENRLAFKIATLLNTQTLNSLVYTPVNKLYVINTYSSSFNDLTANLFATNLQRSIIAINLHSYFNNSTIDIDTELTKILKHIPMTKLLSSLEHDLYELCLAFDTLLEMDRKNA